jgi:hypothetical protein
MERLHIAKARISLPEQKRSKPPSKSKDGVGLGCCISSIVYVRCFLARTLSLQVNLLQLLSLLLESTEYDRHFLEGILINEAALKAVQKLHS